MLLVIINSMNKFKEKANRLGFTNDKIIPLVLAVSITTISFLDSHFFGNHILTVVWVFIAILASILIFAIFMTAGLTVLKSLFFLSAELSLLIFLAQSYCDAHTKTGDSALKILIFLGITYMVFEFFKSLWKALIERLDKAKNIKWSWEKNLVVFLFCIFTTSIVWMIYQVVSPIITNLCIYKN